MKHQQVGIDYWAMLKTSITCLLLAVSGYVLIKMVQTIFWLPNHLKHNQKRLEDLAAQYKIDLNQLEEEALLMEERQENEDETEKIADTEVKEPKKDL